MSVLFKAFLLFAVTSSAFAEHQEDTCLICTDNKFNSKGVINNDPLKNESGSINGVDYHFYYSDGSGSFGDTKVNNYWSSSCNKDIITDAVRCELRKDNIYVYVYHDKNPIVSIGHDHYHKSTVSIRFGTHSPLTISADNDGDFPSGISRDLIAKFISNREVKTRYMEWPYQRWVDKVTDTHGFQVAYSYLEWAVKQITDQQRLEEQRRAEKAAEEQKAIAIRKAEEERKAEAERTAVIERKAEMERKAVAEEMARINLTVS